MQIFNVGGGNSTLVVTAISSATNVLANTDSNITIANGDGTADNTAALHFAREDTDGAPNYVGASVVSQFKETQVTGQYPKADLVFLTSTAANHAPSEKVRITSAGNVGIGETNPTGILHVKGASPHVKMVNTTWGTQSSATSKKTMDNIASGPSYRGMMTELLFTWSQTTADSWVMVRTPQAYSDWKAGGWADFKLTWSGYHASGTAMMMWTAVFGNHHGRTFQWTKTGITTLKNNDSYYGYTPAVAFYRQTTNAHGYNTDDERMRN
jgi:hypothetical protein